jgi:two-component system, OmpR family, sensor histidine kinase ChvG
MGEARTMKLWETSQLGIGVAGLIVISLWSVTSVWRYRTELIDAQVQRLVAQGEIIADALAVPAARESSESHVARVDPTRLIPLRNGEGEDAHGDDPALSAAINLPWIARLLGERPTKTRARVYDRRGVLRLDTDLAGPGNVLRFDLPPPPGEPAGFAGRTLLAVKTWLIRHDRPSDEARGLQNGQGIPELAQALAGHRVSIVRGAARDEVSVSVALPIIRFRAVRGAILLSTKVSGWFDLVRAIRADRGAPVAFGDGA